MTGSYWWIVEPLWNQIKIDSAEIFLDTYLNAPPEAALLYASHFCQSEVCNGGFRQLFFNSTGYLRPKLRVDSAPLDKQELLIWLKMQCYRSVPLTFGIE